MIEARRIHMLLWLLTCGYWCCLHSLDEIYEGLCIKRERGAAPPEGILWILK